MEILGIEHVKRLIPQREPILMVDCIGEVTEDCGIAGLTITGENLFVENGILCEPGIIEHIAQSAAVVMGYECLHENRPVPLGFIASVRNLTVRKRPLVGDSIRTRVNVENRILNVVIVQAKTFLNSEEIASCEMRIFVEG